MKSATLQRAPRRFEEYNWTPLNALPKEVLVKIKKDPKYKKPLPIMGNPPAHKAHKYCSYHGSYGHWTDACVLLRELIKKFITDGKLTRFHANRKGGQQATQPP
jgi:hypothetical protein